MQHTAEHSSKYNWCPECKELWVAAWMTRLGVGTCPLCETPVVPLERLGADPRRDFQDLRLDAASLTHETPRSGRSNHVTRQPNAPAPAANVRPEFPAAHHSDAA